MADRSAELGRLLQCLRALTAKRFVSAPRVPELEFLRLTANHAEFARKLDALGLSEAAERIRANARFVARAWLRLGADHLADAKNAAAAGRDRAAYSRAYYAAYNASKAARYMANGSVTLKGEDHSKAPELPDDCGHASALGQTVTVLYEHRLRADYDNWRSTAGASSLDPQQAVGEAERLLSEVARYLKDKYGIDT